MLELDENGEPIQKEPVKPETPPPPTPVKELSPEALALKKEIDRIFVVAPELNECVTKIESDGFIQFFHQNCCATLNIAIIISIGAH